MGQYISEAVIAMPRAEVWAKLRDLRAARHYVQGVTSIELNAGPREGVGASRKVVVKGRPPVDETAVAWVDGSGFTLKLHEGEKPATPFKWATFQYELQDAPGGQTRVRFILSYELPWGLLGRLFDRLMLRPALKRTTDSLGPAMKKFYETGEATNPLAA